MPYKCSFSLHDVVIDRPEWCGLLWCFISCLDSHSDGTHSLQMIQCVSDVMLNFSKSVPMKKQTQIHIGWPKGKYIFSKCSFLVNYSLNKLK